MTNYERFQSMSVEELAEKLDGLIGNCDLCPGFKFCKLELPAPHPCSFYVAEWLKSEEG